MQSYLQSGGESKDLVRFFYADKEDMFDQVSYQKGGRVIHMLRNFVGDSAFFKSLNLYLTTNKFKAAEAHHLRLAFEEVTGRDLNWFFNQWYFDNGHPSVTIDYVYDDAAGKVNVIIKQVQKSGKLFTLPIAVDIYNGANKVRYNVWAKNVTDTFTFSYTKHPDLVNVDGDKVMLWNKKDNKTLDDFIHQYKYAGKYLDRLEAIQFAAKKQDDPKALELLKTALKDKFHGLRNATLFSLDLKNEKVKQAVEPIIADLAKNDKKSTVRANAISHLGEYKNAAYVPLFKAATKDSSYSVAGNALNALMEVDKDAALTIAKGLDKQPSKGTLKSSLQGAKAASGDESLEEEIIGGFNKMPVSNEKFNALGTLGIYLGALKNTEKVKAAVDEIIKFREAIPSQYRVQTDPYINETLQDIAIKKEEALKADAGNTALKELVDYIKSKIPAGEKKGF
jgi:aminopeptidase N